MSNKRFISVLAGILACLTVVAAEAVERGKLPLASDLAAEAKLARQKKIPILILFSADGCSYCGKVRDEFLVPTTLNAEYDDKVILLEVDVGNGAKLLDFDGKATTQARLAQRYRVGFTPTVMLFDAQGKAVTEPLVGITTSDYYGGYLEDRIVRGIEKIRASSP